jgi:hypothetical protein
MILISAKRQGISSLQICEEHHNHLTEYRWKDRKFILATEGVAKVCYRFFTILPKFNLRTKSSRSDNPCIKIGYESPPICYETPLGKF